MQRHPPESSPETALESPPLTLTSPKKRTTESDLELAEQQERSTGLPPERRNAEGHGARPRFNRSLRIFTRVKQEAAEIFSPGGAPLGENKELKRPAGVGSTSQRKRLAASLGQRGPVVGCLEWCNYYSHGWGAPCTARNLKSGTVD